MSVPATSISFYQRRRYDGPEFFLLGGFVAGLIVFLIWVAMLPDRGTGSQRVRGSAESEASALVAPGRGVLSGITGESGSPGEASIGSGVSEFFNEETTPDETGLAVQEEFEPGYIGEDTDSMAVGEDVGAPVQIEEGTALADSLLDSPMAAPAPAPDTASGAPLLPYYVEIEVAPGQVQVLQLNAESPDHALAILRDFRGDPRVLRGPALEPIE